jgi:hypothetical protein
VPNWPTLCGLYYSFQIVFVVVALVAFIAVNRQLQHGVPSTLQNRIKARTIAMTC